MLQDMMNSKVRKVVVIVGTTALFGAAGTTNATAAGGGAAQQQGTPAGRTGRPSAADVSTLGLPTAEVQAAPQAVPPSGSASSSSPGDDPLHGDVSA
jgi:hypothetical protein